MLAEIVPWLFGWAGAPERAGCAAVVRLGG
jgi:hypothetical protein